MSIIRLAAQEPESGLMLADNRLPLDDHQHLRTFVHRDHIALKAAQKSRSELRRVGALTVRFSTSSWCRNARFSMTR